jgi:DNA-binding response OmpR family regulator
VTLPRQAFHLRPVNAAEVRVDAAHPRDRRTRPTKQTRRTVLYVGDDPHCRIVLSRLVGRLDGVHLMMADTEPEAQHMVALLAPNLVLVDGQLLDCNAQAIIGRLKRGANRTPTPVAVLSGKDGDRIRLIRAGAASLITKPLRLSEVERSIVTLLDVFWVQ